MTAFIQGTKTVGISGGNFRQSSLIEQHENHTRVYHNHQTIVQGNIYGYTHRATSDDSTPIIAYSHITNTARAQDGERFSQLSRHLTIKEPDPILLDMDDELKAEFYTTSPEMQRYVRYMLEQVERRDRGTAGQTHLKRDTVKDLPRHGIIGMAGSAQSVNQVGTNSTIKRGAQHDVQEPEWQEWDKENRYRDSSSSSSLAFDFGQLEKEFHTLSSKMQRYLTSLQTATQSEYLFTRRLREVLMRTRRGFASLRQFSNNAS